MARRSALNGVWFSLARVGERAWHDRYCDVCCKGYSVLPGLAGDAQLQATISSSYGDTASVLNHTSQLKTQQYSQMT
jgi:hypothetical protein